jgi:hypothetical protein
MSAGGTLSTAAGALGLFGNVLPALAELVPARPIKVLAPASRRSRRLPR